MIKRSIMLSLVVIGVTLTAYAGSLPPGKYMLSAPVLSSGKRDYIREWYSEITISDNIYRVAIIDPGKGPGYSIDFKIIDSGKVEIVDGRLSGNRVKGSGALINNQTVKGEITIVSTAWGTLWERSTSEWFLRPATQKEIDDNLKEGLQQVATVLSQEGIERTTENLIKRIRAGSSVGYSYSDIPKIKEMLQSGQIEYKDGEFIIHREAPPEQEPVKPDISPEFQKEEISREEAINAFKEEETAPAPAGPSADPPNQAPPP